jgi:hypothetical protein
VTIDELEARLARIEARLEMLETIEARALSDTEPPPPDDREAETVFLGIVGQARDVGAHGTPSAKQMNEWEASDAWINSWRFKDP